MRNETRHKITNPADHYETPFEVLGDDSLSAEEKLKVLNAYVLDAKLMSTASSEGMGGKGAGDTLQAAQKALEALERETGVAAQSGGPAARHFPYQRILVALDTEDPLVDKILNTATEMARAAGASIRFLTVVPTITPAAMHATYGPIGAGAIASSESEEMAENMVERHRENADRLLAGFAPLGDGRHTIRRGICDNEIVRYAADWPADLLIMGTHKHGWLEGLFRDSTSKAVIGQIGCAVLLVPEAA